MGILKFKNESRTTSYLTVSVLGKVLKLNVKYINTSKVELNKDEYEINLYDLSSAYLTFANYIEEHGYKAMLYGSKYYLENMYASF